MTHELIILRHAKSDWDSAAESDFERPLSKRGKRDAPRMGEALSRLMAPMAIVASPARRATPPSGAITTRSSTTISSPGSGASALPSVPKRLAKSSNTMVSPAFEPR